MVFGLIVYCYSASIIDSVVSPPIGLRRLRIGLQLRLTPYAQLHLDKQGGCPEAIDAIEDQAAAL